MHRYPPLLLLCLVALVTGVALLQAASIVAPPALPPPPPDRVAAAQVALVSRFYTAVNVALRTGDTATLDALVADELIEHPAPAGSATGRAAFIQRVLALRNIFPHLQLHIDDVYATDANKVTARTHPIGLESGDFLSLPVPSSISVWPSLEAFRVEDDQIVEHWVGTDPLVHLKPLFETRRLAPSSGTAYLQVAQVTYPPRTAVPLQATVAGGERLTTNVPRAAEADRRMTYLEAGAVTLTDGSNGSLNPDEWTDIEVTPGTLLQAEPGLSARTDDAESAEVLEVAILGGAPNVVNPIPARAANVKASVRATALIGVDDWPEMAIAAGRVTMIPGATMAFPPASGPILLVVESGELELTARAGRFALPGSWVESDEVNAFSTGKVAVAPNQQLLQTGLTALLEENAGSLWHNSGLQPATVLVLVIAPGGEAANQQATANAVATPPDSWCVEPSGCR